jgi:hypothetical protein
MFSEILLPWTYIWKLLGFRIGVVVASGILQYIAALGGGGGDDWLPSFDLGKYIINRKID